MEPTLTMALLWTLFGATHIGLTTRRLREKAVDRLGEGGFTLLFSLISAIAFSALVVYYALHRTEGPAGLALARFDWIRPIGIGLISTGLALLAASLVAYRSSPMALASHEVRPPEGLARISRHAFFVGLSLFALAHALLASQLIGTLFFGGFAVVSILGARHQDRKLEARFGHSYTDYLATTSFVPFVAVYSKRQYIVWREIPWLGLATGFAIAFALRSVHGSILNNGGAWFIAATVAGAGAEILQYFVRRRRARVEPAAAQI